MVVSFRALRVKSGDTDGKIAIYWKSPRERREEVRLGAYSWLYIDSQGRSWRPPNVGIPPLPVAMIDELLASFQDPFKLTDKYKVKKRGLAGRDVLCAEHHSDRSDTDVCFDAQTGVLLKIDTGWRSYVTREIKEFSDYTQFGDKLYPRKMKLSRVGHTLIEASIDSVSAWSPAAQAFVAPDGYLSRKTCDPKLIKYPKPTFDPDPIFPRAELNTASARMVLVRIAISEQGTVSDARVQYSGGDAFDDEALKAIRTWKFQPSTCGGEPIEREVTIEVTFHRYE